MIPFQSYLITAGLTGLVAFGAGWKVKSWKIGDEHKKAMQELALAANAELKKQKGLTADETERADRLSDDNQDLRQALNDTMQANAILAASRASTTTKIIETGDKIGAELEKDYEWIRFAWPSGLIDYANGVRDDEGVTAGNGEIRMSGAEKTGYR